MDLYIAISLARDDLPGLVSNLTSNAINKSERKINGKGAVRAWKGLTLFILNEDANDIIKIIKLLGDSGVLVDEVTETVKHETKEKNCQFLGALLVQPVISSVVKGISGGGVRRPRRWYTDKRF